MLGPSATALPDIETALTETMGGRRLTSILTALLGYRIKTHTLELDTAVFLVRNGIPHPSLAAFLVAAADGAAPGSASALYDYAIESGADARPLAGQRAEAAALVGDLDTAERLCDTILDRFDTVDVLQLRTAVRISATVAAERGMASRSLQLYT